MLTVLNMHRTQKTLSDYILVYRGRVVLGFLMVFFAQGLPLAAPSVLGHAIDDLTAGVLTSRLLVYYGFFYAAILAMAAGFAFGMRRLILGLAHEVEYDVRRDVFAHLTTLDNAFYQRERTGDIMTKLTSDLGAVRDFVGHGLLQGSRALVSFVFGFAIMFAINKYMASVILCLLPVVSLLFFAVLHVIRDRYDASQAQFSIISNFTQETFAGIRTVKGFGIEELRKRLFKGLNDEYIRRNLSLSRIEQPVWPLMSMLFGISIILLMLIGGREVMRGELTFGQWVQFQQYMFFLQWPMLALGWILNLLQRGLASWKRLHTILDARPDIRDGDETDKSLDKVKGAVAFDGVTLVRDERRLLDDIKLTIPAGATVGITGPTGAGKTLLVSLIARLMDPTSGRVTIGGRELRSYPLEVLRRHVGMAPQEPFLFSDTLARNIAFGLPIAVDLELEGQEEKILWAAEVAHLRGDVDLFPRKFETLLGERGVTLSGGQRQRTAISRALARSPEVLILDDVFSAVDTQTESRILEQLRPVLRERTSIIVSHRISTLRNADLIVVLERGRVTQLGTHDELVRRDGYYRQLDEMQRLEAKLEAG
jgi:ATP-binding cassette subfamily B protein